MNSTLLNIIFLFGAFQALLLIVGVNISRPLKSSKKKATTLLLLIIFLAMVYYVSIVSEWKQFQAYTWVLGNSSWMAIAPAYFIFTKSLISDSFSFKWIHLLFFCIPIIFIIDGLITSIYPNYGMFSWIETMETYLDKWMLIFFTSSTFFIAKSYKLLTKYKDHGLTKPLLIFTKALIIIMLSYALTYILIRKNYHLLFEVSLICLFMVLIFAIVFRAFRLAPTHTFFGEPKYQNLNQKDESNLKDLHTSVKSAISEEKLYLDPKLNLSKLSDKTGISQNQLSQYFNIGLNSTFYEYINEQRLNHVEKLFRNGDYKAYTITGLAFESGFNSKTTFYKAFKDKHNITPSEFIKRVSKIF